MPEPESDLLDRFLRGRRDLMISELTITEVISALARRKREGILDAQQAYQIRDAVLSDAGSGAFRRLDINPGIHREAERILLSTEFVALRTLDALHIALALSGASKCMITFDGRLAELAALHGLQVLEFRSADSK